MSCLQLPCTAAVIFLTFFVQNVHYVYSFLYSFYRVLLALSVIVVWNFIGLASRMLFLLPSVENQSYSPTRSVLFFLCSCIPYFKGDEKGDKARLSTEIFIPATCNSRAPYLWRNHISIKMMDLIPNLCGPLIHRTYLL